MTLKKIEELNRAQEVMPVGVPSGGDVKKTSSASIFSKFGFSESPDEVYASLKAKNNKTPLEKEFIQLYEAQNSKTSKKAYNLSTNKDVFNYIKILLSDIDRDKKVTEILKEYFKDDEKFQKMSDEERKSFINQHIKDFSKLLNLPNKKLSDDEQKKFAVRFIALLAASKEQNLSIADLKKLTDKDIKSLISQTVSSHIHDIIKSIPDFEKKSSSEQIYGIVDLYLSVTDEKYNKLAENKKIKYCQQKTDEFIAKMMDIPSKKFNLEEMTKDFPHIKFDKLIKYCVENNIDFEKMMNSSSIGKMKFFVGFLESQKELSEEEKSHLKQTKARLDLITKCKDPENATEGEIYNLLLEKQKKGEKLSKEEQVMLDTYNFIANNKNLTKEDIEGVFAAKCGKAGNFEIMKALGANFTQYVELRLDKIKDVNSSEFKKELVKLVEGARSDHSNIQYDELIEYLKKRGIPEKDVRDYLKSLGLKGYDHLSAAEAVVTGNVKEIGASQKIANKIGTVKDRDFQAECTKEAVKYTKNVEDTVQLGSISAKNGYETSFTKGLNKYYSPERAANIAGRVLISGNLTKEQQKSFAKSMITTTNDDSRKLYYAKELSKISSPAVQEGLIQGASTIQDESIRNEYVETVNVNSTTVSSNSYSYSPAVQNEARNITSYTSSNPEKNVTKAYFAYLNDVNSKLEQKRNIVANKAKEVQTHIEESQKYEELESVEKLYKGISVEVIEKLNVAYIQGGVASVYEKLGDLQWKDAQKAFLMYVIRNCSGAELRNFAAKFSDNIEVLQAICTYGNVNDLPADLIVKGIEKGWVKISSISDIQSLLNDQKNNLTFLRHVFDATKNYSIFVLNFDLLTEYISLGKINLALLPPSLYMRYKNSLTPVKQKELDEKLEQEKFALKTDANSNISSESTTEFLNIDFAAKNTNPIPGSPEFYAMLNQQSEKYNPNNYFTGTLYDPRRIKKINRKG